MHKWLLMRRGLDGKNGEKKNTWPAPIFWDTVQVQSIGFFFSCFNVLSNEQPNALITSYEYTTPKAHK